MTLPGNAAIPAPDSRRNALAHESGRRIVGMVSEGLTIDAILTRGAFENAIRALSAIGGSTNGVVHLLALARRLGVELQLSDFDALGSRVPLLVNLQPSGKFLMEDFYYAGGLPAVMRELLEGGLLQAGARTVNGRTMGENVAQAPKWGHHYYLEEAGTAAAAAAAGGAAATPATPAPAVVIGTLGAPIKPEGGVVVLRGNLSPAGAILKPSAASPALFRHRGRAHVFASIEELKATIDAPDLPVTPDSVLVLQGAGPVGYPGMPEVGNMPLPRRMLEMGVRDMVRISDARMSGTAYGTVVLHCSPESAVGGPLALVRTGDWIELDVPARRLHLEVGEAELAARRAEWRAPPPVATRGYAKMYIDNVNQAHEGADLAFLQGSSGHGVPRESH